VLGVCGVCAVFGVGVYVCGVFRECMCVWVWWVFLCGVCVLSVCVLCVWCVSCVCLCVGYVLCVSVCGVSMFVGVVPDVWVCVLFVCGGCVCMVDV
jgi:hypothetical protein